MCATAVAEMTFSGDRTGGAKPEGKPDWTARSGSSMPPFRTVFCTVAAHCFYFCALILYAFPWGIL